MTVEVFEVQIGGVTKAIRSMDDLKEAIKLAKQEADKGIFGSASAAKANQTLNTLTATQRRYNEVVKETIKEKQAEDNTYRGLSTRLNILRNSYKDLVVQEKHTTDAGRALLSEVTKLDLKLKNIDARVGQFQRNIGNYLSAFGDIGTQLSRVGLNLVGSFGITSAADVVAKTIKGVINLQIEFQDELRKLSSLTGVTGDDLEELGRRAIEMSADFGTSAKEILAGFSLVGGAQPQLLKNAEALAEVTKQAEILSKAGGITLEEAVNSLVGTMNQYGVSADKAAEFTDVLATSQQLGTARIEQLSESFVNAGGAARAVGLSFEETNVLLQALAAGGTLGAEAGTQLRSTLLKLATSGKDELNPALHDMGDILETLATKYSDVTQLEEIFGERSIATVLTLINQRNVVAELTGKLNDHGNALRQAETNTDTVDTAWNRFTKSIEAQIVSGSEANDVLKFLINSLGVLSETHSKTTASQRALILTTGGLSEAFKFLWKAINNGDGDNGAARSKQQIDDINKSLTEFDAIMEDVNRKSAIQAELQKDQEAIAKKGTLGGLKQQQKDLQESLELLTPETQKFIDTQKELEAITEKINNATKSSTKIKKDAASAAKDAQQAAQKEVTALREQLELLTIQSDKKREPFALIDSAKEIEVAQKIADEKLKIAEKELSKKLISQTKFEAEKLKIQQDFEKTQTDVLKKEAEQRSDIAKKELEKFLIDSKSLLEDNFDRNFIISDDVVNAEIDRLEDINNKSKAILDQRLADQLISQQDYEIESLKLTELFFDQVQALEAKRQADAEKLRQQDLARKAFDFNTELDLASLRGENEFELRRKELENNRTLEIAEAEKLGADVQAVKDKYRALDLQLEEQQQRAKAELNAHIFGQIADLFGRNTIASKAAAIAEASINTYLAATAALADKTIPGPARFIQAALAIAFGLKQVAKIEGIKLEYGGSIDPTGKVTTLKPGVIQGKLHSEGGNKGKIFGKPVETERGEFFDYDEHGNAVVINRRSTSQHERVLNRMKGIRFDGKRSILRSINASRGQGVIFAAEGVSIPRRPEGFIEQLNAGLTISPQALQMIALAVRAGSEEGSRIGSMTGTEISNREAIKREKFSQATTL